MLLEWVLLGLSTLLFLIFLITNLKKYDIRIFNTAPKLSLYEITPKISGYKNVYWIPSIFIRFKFQNLTGKIKRIGDIRVKINNSECIYARWLVDYDKFRKDSRLGWIQDKNTKDWSKIVLYGKKTLNVVFEGQRWDGKITGSFIFVPEILFKNKWRKLKSYRYIIKNEDYEKKIVLGYQ